MGPTAGAGPSEELAHGDSFVPLVPPRSTDGAPSSSISSHLELLPTSERLASDDVEEEAELETVVAKKRKRRTGHSVSFGEVRVLEHEPILVNDRLPSTEGPGVGLGRLCSVKVRRCESYDFERECEREGVRHLDAAERRERLVELTRPASIDAAEMEAELTRRGREESQRDVVSPRPPSRQDEGPALTDLWC